MEAIMIERIKKFQQTINNLCRGPQLAFNASTNIQ